MPAETPADNAPEISTPKTDAERWGNTAAFLAAAPESPPAAAAATPPSDLALNFRHSGWAHNRSRVEAALIETPGVSARRLGAFRTCGSDAYVEQSDYAGCVPQNHTQAIASAIKTANPTYRLRSTKCHDRFCVPCSNERSNRVRASLLAHMQGRPNLSLITLTLAASDRTLADCLDRITKSFRALRTKKVWKKAVQGGVTIVETKVGAGSGQWHCHLHIIAQTTFMRQTDLSDAWHAVTGDSMIVDIRRVGAISGAVQYITKYVTKAADRSIVETPARLTESITAFTGRRLISTFGTWRGLQLMERPDDEKSADVPQSAWRTIGRLEEILTAARNGDPVALRIVAAIAPRKFHASGPAPPQFPSM